MEYFKPLPGHPSQNASPPTQPRSAFSRGLYYTDIPCNAGNHNPPSCVNPLPTDYPCSTVRVRIQVHGPLENRDFYPYNTGIACSPSPTSCQRNYKNINTVHTRFYSPFPSPSVLPVSCLPPLSPAVLLLSPVSLPCLLPSCLLSPVSLPWVL